MTQDYWQNRYDTKATGWDLGAISPPIQAYIEHLIAKGVDKNSRILIAGAGNSHEAEYLHHQGFTQVIVVDIAQTPLENFAERVPSFPKAYLIQTDFFELDPVDVQFDFIIEQTFFCAIDPSLRPAYAKKMRSLLKNHGELFGLLFDDDFAKNPPFGGHRAEYQSLFEQYFDQVSIEPCYNSIASRQGQEVFIRLA
ncbi:MULTISPECIES: methyltransferase domain-containing protein [unclassified Acinetobacter]|uniref:methyltransferase domain-containing protein n=1 Tax=unclassified Acinetobacter TaxID=196816 RepID=UPI0035B88048